MEKNTNYSNNRHFLDFRYFTAFNAKICWTKSSQIHFVELVLSMSATRQIKLLGVEIDNKITFDENVRNLCQKVSKKTRVFSRLNTDISQEQALSICNVAILSNFNYCFLIWIFCNKSANEKIHRANR